MLRGNMPYVLAAVAAAIVALLFLVSWLRSDGRPSSLRAPGGDSAAAAPRSSPAGATTDSSAPSGAR
jgi:hypothetical protein